MPLITYVEKRFQGNTQAVVDNANAVLNEYADQNIVLTLRSLFYQFVARNLFPDDRKWRWTGSRWARDPNGTKNAEPNYRWLSSIISDARLAGLVDWDHLIDRTRHLADLEHFDSASDALTKLAGWYHIDMWENQKYRPEVWIEKDAVVGYIEPVCHRWDVPYFSCRGYTSQSEMWRAGMRVLDHADGRQIPIILHFGDHDPSGIDMSRDIGDRLQMFCGSRIQFERLALNWDQIEGTDLPPSPAKLTDSRAEGYIAEFGDDSWELDAMEPKQLQDLIEGFIKDLVKDKVWTADLERKRSVKAKLSELALNWEE